MSKVDRRTFLAATLAAGGAVSLGSDPAAAAARRCRTHKRARIAQATGVRFDQGVAAGQPSCRGITLWTHVEGLDRSANVTLEVATDPDFRRVVARRSAVASAPRNGAVHTRLSGCPLVAGERYWYRFSTRDADSPVGRFRTARPPDSREPVRIGFFSCQDYEEGFYTAHAGLAAEDDLDLVVSLGDYIYENANAEDEGVRDDRTGDESQEVLTLDHYRAKYGLYHSDTDLQALRAAHPIMAIWDDHEVDNDHAGLNADVEEVVPFPERRANAYRAFFEAMPRIRARRDRDRIYGAIPLGRTAELILLDERQYRSDQPCDGVQTASCPEASSPSQTMLGARQKAWFQNRLRSSPATWKLVGNQVMMMSLDAPAGNPLNPDQWDGYKVERQEILTDAARRGVENIAFLTGDIHVFFAGQVTPSGRQPHPGTTNLQFGGSVATEFVGGSMTSSGEAVEAGEPTIQEIVNDLTDPVIRANNPHIVFSEAQRRGYGVLEARADRLDVTFRAAQTVRQPRSEVFDLARFRVAAGRPVVEVLGGARRRRV
jgi:alkaline phosphatase D